jgi:hypothetical protein
MNNDIITVLILILFFNIFGIVLNSLFFGRNIKKAKSFIKNRRGVKNNKV